MTALPWLAAAASLALCAALSFWIINLERRLPSATSPASITTSNDVDLVARDVVGSHIRSMMAEHLTDVVSEDRHTVKPWFGGKLPFAITVPDLGTEGFKLEGGRLDYIAGRDVAALVYRRRQHVINLFVWPQDNEPPQETTVQEGPTRSADGYEAISWTANGRQHWAVSDVNNTELREFIRLFQRDE